MTSHLRDFLADLPPSLGQIGDEIPLTGWGVLRPGLVRCPAPPGHVTVADLAAPQRVAALMDRMPEGHQDRKQLALTPVHLAVTAVAGVLAAPLLLDGVVVRADAGGLGLVLDDDFGMTAYWASDAVTAEPVRPGAGAVEVGAAAAALLDPVLELARDRGRISRRNAETVLLDALLGAGIPWHRLAPDAERWPAFVAGTGFRSSRPSRAVTTRPDAGEPVTLPAQRICCVLANRPTAHACPTCPVRPTGTHTAEVEQYLRDLDDTDFHLLTGRRRHPRPG